MALTLPHERTAIVVIECQNDLIHESKIGSGGIGGALAAAVRERDVLGRIAPVLTAARAVGVPILYANKESKPGIPTTNAPIFRIGKRQPILQEGSWGAEVHPAIAPQPGDLVIRRFLSVDASYGSGLFGTLRALDRTLIIAMGVSTNFAVEGTVRGAVNRLFEVVIPEDCCASVPYEMHRFSMERILSLLGTVTTSNDVVGALQQS
ncbi:MAG TPA: cysteine hydrolase [Candidatus Acidoferrales bacterium]|nr:cysteine hydrolase [Candidatus Acidoferrales bacterium]